MTMSKDYTFFSNYKQYALDDYWKNIFDNCSQGKFPDGSWYDNNTTSVKVKSRENHTITIPLIDEDYKNFLEIRKAFTVYLGLSSSTEEEKSRILDQENKQKKMKKLYEFDAWNTIKSKSLKDILINQYIEEVTKDKKLSRSQTNSLKNVIFLGLSEKRLLSEDVIIKDNKIIDIKNIEYVDNHFKLTREFKSSTIKQPEKKNTSNTFSDSFFKNYKS